MCPSFRAATGLSPSPVVCTVPDSRDYQLALAEICAGPESNRPAAARCPVSLGNRSEPTSLLSGLRNCPGWPRRSPFLCFQRLALPVPDLIVQHPPALVIRAVPLSVQRTVSAVRGCFPVRHIAPEQRLVKIDVSHVNLLSVETKETKKPSFLYNLFNNYFFIYFWYPLVSKVT